MASRQFFALLILAVAVERLGELALSQRNRRRALARGAVESGQGHYAVMVVVHTLLLAAAPLEVWFLGRSFWPALGWPMLALVGLTMALRYWAIATLGEHWNTRILVVPGVRAVSHGPYRFLRHPNYVAVTIEVAALPLVHSAWCSALLFSVANALLLAVRIAAEERALAAHSAYQETLGERPRFLPRWRAGWR
jgi:methyltransferase